MYFLDTATVIASLNTFWDAIKGYLPPDVTVTPDPAGDVIEDTTGDLTGSWGSTAGAAHTGTYTAPHAAPAGGVIDWLTDTILDGHRLRGRSFIVPLSSGCYEADGSLGAAYITGMEAAASAFIASQSSSFVVWHRPYPGREATTGHPAKPAHAGGHGLVTFHHVPDMAAILRSRRD